MLEIIYRCCDRINCVSGAPRHFAGSKLELIKLCFSALIRSISLSPVKGTTLTVVDDHSSAELKEFVLDNTKGLCLRFVSLDSETGNGASLKQCYQEGINSKAELLFFLEDDYLLAPEAVSELLGASEHFSRSLGRVILHPIDEPDRYRKPYPSYILLGPDRHWRTVKHTTGTFMLPYSILVDYWGKYMNFTEYGITPGVSEDNTINLVYSEIPCLSPIPGLAHHMQYEHTLSPFKRWESWAT